MDIHLHIHISKDGEVVTSATPAPEPAQKLFDEATKPEANPTMQVRSRPKKKPKYHPDDVCKFYDKRKKRVVTQAPGLTPNMAAAPVALLMKLGIKPGVRMADMIKAANIEGYPYQRVISLAFAQRALIREVCADETWDTFKSIYGWPMASTELCELAWRHGWLDKLP
jgi:hypothetical protein